MDDDDNNDEEVLPACGHQLSMAITNDFSYPVTQQGLCVRESET